MGGVQQPAMQGVPHERQAAQVAADDDVLAALRHPWHAVGVEIANRKALADRLERIAFNVLPTQASDDFTGKQYYSLVNQVVCARRKSKAHLTDHSGTDVVYAEESHEGNVLESIRHLDGTDEHKLITANSDNPRGLQPVELYRVDLDPGERENLAGSSPDQVRLATKALLQERARADEDAVAADSVELDDDVAAHLEAIGYMER